MHLIKYVQKYKTPTCFGNEVPKHVGVILKKGV
jgi:hypothetical protein